jgi:hypothetical protein
MQMTRDGTRELGVKLNVMGLKTFICVRMGVKSKCDEMQDMTVNCKGKYLS